MIRSSQQLNLGMSDEPHPALALRVGKRPVSHPHLMLLLSVLSICIVLALNSASAEVCRFHQISFPEPTSPTATQQSGIRFGSVEAQCFAPAWLQDSIALFFPSWVESARELSEPIADPDFRFDREAIWIHRVISYDTLKSSMIIETRHTGFKYLSWEFVNYQVESPLYAAVNLATKSWVPLVHGTSRNLVELINQAAAECAQVFPSDLICRSKLFVALEYESQSLVFISSPEDIARAYMMCQEGPDIGWITGEELYLEDVGVAVDNHVYDRDLSKRVVKELKQMPREYATRITAPAVTGGVGADTVRLWVYAFDSGEVAEWEVFFDKVGKLMAITYAHEPVRVLSGALTIGGPWQRQQKEVVKQGRGGTGR